jgi:hypothetical protein
MSEITGQTTINQKKRLYGLCVACFLVTAVILIVDLSIPLGVAGGVPYITVVLLSLKSPTNRFTIFVAITCSLLTVVGFFASPAGGEMWKVLFNRALALFAIWVTAFLALKQRTKDLELLEEQKKRLQNTKDLEVQEERLKVLKATMRTVQDIVGNFLNKLLLFQMEAEDTNALKPESLELMESFIDDTALRLKKLGDLDTVIEKDMAGGLVGIEYEQSPKIKIDEEIIDYSI